MDDFFERVYQVACQIPVGRVTSYGAIARYLGTTRSARMVGWAMNKSSTYKVYVPAHRVLNSKGILTGKHYFGNTNVMQELLENEGVKVQNDQVVDFERLFWDPTKELELE
ncbi:MGMT family protein [Sunxiuqinia sp. A32]|uniref:MGMT family protein n=1 Tax=Sunxiuqinia sp. A32 TaxID=3461496 RepID=UPI0040467474